MTGSAWYRLDDLNKISECYTLLYLVKSFSDKTCKIVIYAPFCLLLLKASVISQRIPVM